MQHTMNLYNLIFRMVFLCAKNGFGTTPYFLVITNDQEG
jgi:hypothetical protein